MLWINIFLRLSYKTSPLLSTVLFLNLPPANFWHLFSFTSFSLSYPIRNQNLKQRGNKLKALFNSFPWVLFAACFCFVLHVVRSTLTTDFKCKVDLQKILLEIYRRCLISLGLFIIEVTTPWFTAHLRQLNDLNF